MHVRLVLIGAALLNTRAFAADAPKAPVQPATQPQIAPPPVVLASAENVRAASGADQQAATPTKHPRVARVTTCRCGGQDSEADAQPEE